jgi:hypothetical protein
MREILFTATFDTLFRKNQSNEDRVVTVNNLFYSFFVRLYESVVEYGRYSDGSKMFNVPGNGHHVAQRMALIAQAFWCYHTRMPMRAHEKETATRYVSDLLAWLDSGASTCGDRESHTDG